MTALKREQACVPILFEIRARTAKARRATYANFDKPPSGLQPYVFRLSWSVILNARNFTSVCTFQTRFEKVFRRRPLHGRAP